ncbi:hypothetical protein [Streptomyces sp. NPDC055287]
MPSAALRPHALPPRTLTRLTPADCTATQWSPAQAKASAENRVLAFIANGLHPDTFTDDLYRTCSQHLFAHIAHFVFDRVKQSRWGSESGSHCSGNEIGSHPV